MIEGYRAVNGPKTRVRLMALALVLMAPIGAGMVQAGHVGTPGGGSLDGWVDVHGDTMDGPLVMRDDVRFEDASGLHRGLGLGDNGSLRFDDDDVCLAGSPAPGCGTVTGVRAAWGLYGGGNVGALHLGVDPTVVQSRIKEACPPEHFLHAVAPDGTPSCAPGDTYTDADAIAAVDGAGFAHSGDLAPVATSGSFLDLDDLSLNALTGMACTFEGLDGVVALSFSSRGDIGLACDAGIDFDTDPAHCGGANQAVPEWPNAVVGCIGGEPILVSCVEGFYDLDGDPTNGCESDTVCEPPLTLVDGQCVDLATDPNNCGEPGNVVPDAPNAETGCVDGTYAILSCHEAYADMDGVFHNGCETAAQLWCPDDDGDGFGGTPCQMAFEAPPGWVSNSDDCNDWDGNVNPAAAEIQDGIDNDCNGIIDG